ncbi:MAG TPA: hypothetical protein VFE62_10815 [Gemmataceae bacterium]|nr:hypothetical protein [Gemmataceae bacterium]
MSASHPSLADLRKTSRIAALISLAGVFIVIVAILFSTWRLADTEVKLGNEKQQVIDLKQEKELLGADVSNLRSEKVELHKQKDNLQKQIQIVRGEKTQLEKEVADIAASIAPSTSKKLSKSGTPIDQIKQAVDDRNDLENQVAVIRQEANLIRSAFKNQFKDPKEALKLWNDQLGSHRIMATVLLTPASTYREKIDPASPTGKWYDFKLYLEFPQDVSLADTMKRDIRVVKYEMNNPFRKVAPLESSDAKSQFAKHYQGSGTLRNVVVRIEFRDKDLPVLLDYDMTKAHPEAALK